MKYCYNCGNPMEDDMLFCQKCGTKNDVAPAVNEVHEEPLSKKDETAFVEEKKPKKKKGVLVFAVIVLVIAFIGAVANSNNQGTMAGTEPEGLSATKASVLDVEQYGNISGDELVALLGEPDKTSKSTCQGKFDIPCVYYEYNDVDILGEVSFVLVNNQVVRLTSYSNYPYKDKNSVFKQFGISKEATCAIAADTGVALRYRCPSSKVDDLWINLIDGNSFEFLQVTYDMEYYEEWYLTLSSDEEIKYKSNAELTMKSLLKSPKSADFPWYDWQYGKNLFYVAVSSYVDAENSFGVKMRNTFTFVYSRLTGEIVLAKVNDEVVTNSGYVATEKLVRQLYDETKKAATTANKNAPTETNDSVSDKPSETAKGTSQANKQAEIQSSKPNKGNEDAGKTAEHNHTYAGWKYYDATNHYQSCSKCGVNEYASHSWGTGAVTKQPTCSGDGEITYTCAICSAEKLEGIPVKEHQWSAGAVTREATCTQEGTMTYSCLACTTEKYESIPKVAHKFTNKTEGNKHLKARATYTSGSVYYYSCFCGESGTDTFYANDRIEWVTTPKLQKDFNLSSAWLHESELYLYTYYAGLGNPINKYLIYSEMRNGMGTSVYKGSYNGVTVRFYSSSSGYVFNYDDLVAAGII